MISEMTAQTTRLSAFPKSIKEPSSYYRGLSATGRPHATNLVGFLRTTRQTLQQKNFANRLHHRHVLLLVLETAGSVIVDGTEHRLRVGQACYVKPFQFHHYLNLDRDSLRWLFLTFDLESGQELLATVSDQALTPGRRDIELWREIAYHCAGDDGIPEKEALPVLDHLLYRLSGRGTPPVGARPRHSWIARAEALILQSVETGWTFEEIGRKLGLSGRQLRNRFEAEMGVSLRDYRANYQLHRALALIQNRELPMGRIAELSGFQSQPVFNRFIKRQTGRTPGELRSG